MHQPSARAASTSVTEVRQCKLLNSNIAASLSAVATTLGDESMKGDQSQENVSQLKYPSLGVFLCRENSRSRVNNMRVKMWVEREFC